MDSRNVVALRELALISLVDGDATAAAGLINQIASIEPNDRSLPVLRARVLLVDGKNEEAEAVLATIKEQTPEIRALRAKIASTVSTDVSAFELAVSEDPKNITAIARLCVLYRKDDPAKSLEFCKKANELEPNKISTTRSVMEQLLVKAQKLPAAIRVMRSLQDRTGNSTVRANLATALFHSKL